MSALCLTAAVACGTAPDGKEGEASLASAAIGAGQVSSGAVPPGTALWCSRTDTPGNMFWGGGPVIAGTVHVYFVWYGLWSVGGNLTPGQQVLVNLASSIGGSPYFAINSEYAGSNGAVTGDVVLAGQAFDPGSRGTNLGPGDTAAITASAVTSGKLPADSNGVYVVVAAPGVHETSSHGSYCTSYCGYHESTNVNGVDLKFAFLGDPLTCPASNPCFDACAGPPWPNGAPDGDGLTSVFAHELMESVTDPFGTGWHDTTGENGDKCAWDYGPTYITSNGAIANTRLGGHDYLLQQAWVNAGPGYCSTALPTAPSCSVTPGCGSNGVGILCAPAHGDLVFRRNGTPFTTVYAFQTINGASQVDYPTNTGTDVYDVCLSTPSGQYCNAPTPVTVPLAACAGPLKCPKGKVDCGGYCAPPRTCM